MKKSVIGVFDSGIGGLTVLRELIKMFPHEDFLYVADQGHCPYGTKTPEQISERVKKVTGFLVSQNAKAIVIACNTASVRIASAREVTSVPVISVIQPTCKRAVQLTKNKKVAVLATRSTINSGVYQSLLEKSGITPVPLACSEFVEILENCTFDSPQGRAIVRGKLLEIKDGGMDVLIHGCTHFSLLEPQMREVLGDVTYVACGRPTGEELYRVLKENNLFCGGGGAGCVRILTTGSVEMAEKSMKWFKAAHTTVKKAVIE